MVRPLLGPSIPVRGNDSTPDPLVWREISSIPDPHFPDRADCSPAYSQCVGEPRPPHETRQNWLMRTVLLSSVRRKPDNMRMVVLLPAPVRTKQPTLCWQRDRETKCRPPPFGHWEGFVKFATSIIRLPSDNQYRHRNRKTGVRANKILLSLLINRQ